MSKLNTMIVFDFFFFLMFWYPLHLAKFLPVIGISGMKNYMSEQTDVLKCLFLLNAEPGFPGLNPPIPWEHAPRPHFPLVPASWPYGLHQNFMHQGNARFQPNKPFYTQGTIAYKCINVLGGYWDREPL